MWTGVQPFKQKIGERGCWAKDRSPLDEVEAGPQVALEREALSLWATARIRHETTRPFRNRLRGRARRPRALEKRRLRFERGATRTARPVETAPRPSPAAVAVGPQAGSRRHGPAISMESKTQIQIGTPLFLFARPLATDPRSFPCRTASPIAEGHGHGRVLILPGTADTHFCCFSRSSIRVN